MFSRKIRHVAIRSSFYTLDFYKVWRTSHCVEDILYKEGYLRGTWGGSVISSNVVKLLVQWVKSCLGSASLPNSNHSYIQYLKKKFWIKLIKCQEKKGFKINIVNKHSNLSLKFSAKFNFSDLKSYPLISQYPFNS